MTPAEKILDLLDKLDPERSSANDMRRISAELRAEVYKLVVEGVRSQPRSVSPASAEQIVELLAGFRDELKANNALLERVLAAREGSERPSTAAKAKREKPAEAEPTE
jgi:hypothetical protein